MSMLKLPPTRLDRFEASVGFHLRRAHERAQQQLAASLIVTGLMPIHAEALAVIADNPGITPSAVADGLGRDRSSITGILRTLVDHGLVERGHTIRDRRAALLRLSTAGEAMLRRVERHMAAWDAALDRVLAADKPEVIAQLRRLAAALADGERDDDPGDDV